MPAGHSAKSVFLLAADLPPEARRALLDAHCDGNPGLRAEVESLLRHDPGQDPLARPGHGAEPAAPRSRIGPYTIDSLIAEGASAAVYAAHQTSPQRRVALKVLRRSAGADLWKRRFEREAEILARLDHPGIAHFYACGTTPPPESRTYIAMELVEGEPITAFAERHALPLTQRVLLLAQACDAAEYGHRRGVIHRDLKPGNILVSREAGADPSSARVRLIDFGVARLTDPSAPLTATGLLIGTPAYMSPEQIRSDPNSVDTRSDVYALGVILYELACGRTPFGSAGSVPIEMLRRISEEEPTRLGLVAPGLRGDLEVIAAKALSRDVAVRYQTAAELASDLRRFVDRRPIHARKPSGAYLLRSFVRRNRTLAAATGAALVFLFAGAGVSVWAGLKSRAEARESARDAEFWKGLFDSLWEVPGSQAARRQLLSRAIPHLEARAASRPDDPAVTLALARAYTALSAADLEQLRLESCRGWRERAFALTSAMSRLHPDDTEVSRELARGIILLGDVDKHAGAEGPMFDRYLAALAIHERLAKAHPDDPGIADDLFWSYQRLADLYGRCGEREIADRMFALQHETARANEARWPDRADAICALSITLQGRATRYESVSGIQSPEYEEALTLARRLATGEGAGKQHISLFIRIGMSEVTRRHNAGRDEEAHSLMAECGAVLQAHAQPPGEETLLDEARLSFMQAQVVMLDEHDEAAEALRIAREALPYARAVEAAAAPGDAGRRGVVAAWEARIRELEGKRPRPL